MVLTTSLLLGCEVTLSSGSFVLHMWFQTWEHTKVFTHVGLTVLPQCLWPNWHLSEARTAGPVRSGWLVVCLHVLPVGVSSGDQRLLHLQLYKSEWFKTKVKSQIIVGFTASLNLSDKTEGLPSKVGQAVIYPLEHISINPPRFHLVQLSGENLSAENLKPLSS